MEDVGERESLEMHTACDISQEEPPTWMDEGAEEDVSFESTEESAAFQRRCEGGRSESGQTVVERIDVGEEKSVRSGPATRATKDRTNIPRPAANVQAGNKTEPPEFVVNRG
jgi:hypothetical protein